MPIQTIKLAFYTGTGSTALTADYLAAAFEKRSITVTKEKITVFSGVSDGNCDLLVLLYPVHAFNAPNQVYKWLKALNPVKGCSAAVISVSGGGEVFPNTACRTKCIKLLKQKGFHVFYEKMIVMPSNFADATPAPVAAALLQLLPKKAEKIAEDLLKGIQFRTKPLVYDRLFIAAGRLETIGAKWLGKTIKASASCISCGKCAGSCPAGNITMEENKPVFGKQCNLCMNCFYICPATAITPGLAKFIVLKEGYDLIKMAENADGHDMQKVLELCKSKGWSGVKKYFEED